MKREKGKRTRVALFLFLFPRRLLSSPLTLIFFFFLFLYCPSAVFCLFSECSFLWCSLIFTMQVAEVVGDFGR